MSAIPYIACGTFTACLGILSNTIVTKGLLSRRNLRRVFNGIGEI